MVLIQNTPRSFTEFRKICSELLQGMDPSEDIYYWNMWVDSRTNDTAEFSRFINKIATGEI